MEKNRFKQLLESELGNVKPLITEENETINFLLRRWDLFKEKFDSELMFSSAGVCRFKKEDDFNGYFTHMSQSVLKSMFMYSVPDLGKSTKDDLLKFVTVGTEAIRDNFMDEIKKHYKSTKCKS